MTDKWHHSESGEHKHRIRLAVLLAVFLLIGFSGIFGGARAVTDEDNRPPVVTDWGVFDVSSNKETSMLYDGTLRQDSGGTTLFVRFNHNVAGEQLTANNLSKISVMSSDGRPVEAQVWVKSTTTEFQYRQYIFITLANNLDPEKGYQIVIAPGLQANNTYVNETGDTLFFAYAGTSGVQEQASEEETKEQPSQEQEKEPVQKTTDAKGSGSKGSGNSKGSGSTSGGNGQGSRGASGSQTAAGTRSAEAATSTRPATTAASQEQAPLQRSRIRKLSDEAAALLKSEDAYLTAAGSESSGSGHEGNPQRIVVVLILVAIAESGTLAELKSFERRLKKRSKAA